MDKKAKFQSASLLLDVLQNEYKADEKAYRVLYNRAGVALGAIGIYGFLLLQFIPSLGREKVLLIEGVGAVSLSGIMYSASIVSAIAAVFFLLRILFAGPLKRIDLGIGFDENSGKKPKDRTAMELANVYRELCRANGGILESKRKAFRAALRMLIISLVLLLFYFAMVYVVLK